MAAKAHKRTRDDEEEAAQPAKRPSRRATRTAPPPATQDASNNKGSSKSSKAAPKQKQVKKQPSKASKASANTPRQPHNKDDTADEPRRQRNGFLETPYTQYVRQAQRQLTTIGYVQRRPWWVACTSRSASCGVRTALLTGVGVRGFPIARTDLRSNAAQPRASTTGVSWRCWRRTRGTAGRGVARKSSSPRMRWFGQEPRYGHSVGGFGGVVCVFWWGCFLCFLGGGIGARE